MQSPSNLSRRAAISTVASALALSAMPCRASSVRGSGGDRANIKIHDIAGITEELAQAIHDQVLTLPGGREDAITRVTGNHALLVTRLRDAMRDRGLYTAALVDDGTFIYAPSQMPKLPKMTQEKVKILLSNSNTKVILRTEPRNVVVVSLDVLPSRVKDAKRVIMTSSSSKGSIELHRMMRKVTSA